MTKQRSTYEHHQLNILSEDHCTTVSTWTTEESKRYQSYFKIDHFKRKILYNDLKMNWKFNLSSFLRPFFLELKMLHRQRMKVNVICHYFVENCLETSLKREIFRDEFTGKYDPDSFTFVI